MYGGYKPRPESIFDSEWENTRLNEMSPSKTPAQSTPAPAKPKAPVKLVPSKHSF